jgi:hypothetical protein
MLIYNKTYGDIFWHGRKKGKQIKKGIYCNKTPARHIFFGGFTHFSFVTNAFYMACSTP